MKKTFKSSLAVILVLALLSGFAFCVSAEATLPVDQDVVAKHYGQYKNYVLLGDSIASGYRETISKENMDYNYSLNETAFVRAPGSYSDIIANSIIEDQSMTPFAGPAFRTIEIRYMLEDDYEGDKYLFHHPFHDKSMGKHQDYVEEYRAAIANADLITLGVGGNDWGQMLSWAVADITLSAENGNKYNKEIKEILENSTDFDQETLDQLIAIADKAGLVPALIEYLPQAINYGLQTFYENWDIMIEDIYSYNPDVTLVVVGLCDTDYVAPEEATAVDTVKKMLVDAILTVGNKPMIDGAEKFGYIYVDVTGATFEGGHPDENGHVYMANAIMAALPDPAVAGVYTDISTRDANYKAIETMITSGAMAPKTETTFEPDTYITKSELKFALNTLTDSAVILEGDKAASRLNVAMAAANAALSGNFPFATKFSALTFAFKYAFAGNITEKITRAEAAVFFYDFINL